MQVTLTARVGIDPQFAGSIHDDSSARLYGYQGALVPGPLVYGYLSRIPVELWGAAFLERGTMSSRNRRPVYDGQVVTVAATETEEDAAGKRISIVVRDADGNDMAVGEAALPHAPAPPPALDGFAVMPPVEHPPTVVPGGMAIGTRLRSDAIPFTPELQRDSLADFGDTWPGYRRDGIVHAGYLMRRAVRDGVLSFSYPTPSIYVSGWAQHFALARVGDTLATAGHVTAVYERKGQHYFDAEQVMVANGTRPIALFRRTTIYAVRQAPAA